LDPRSRSSTTAAECAEREHRSEFEKAFATLAQRGATALVISSDQLIFNQREKNVALAARHSIPTIYDRRELQRSAD
jgi:hypothetical protein